MTTDAEKQAVRNIYGWWAPIYDLVFGSVFECGRRAVIAASERIGGRILEVGVGTGLSLPYYSEKSLVFGVDLSEQMLRKARQRVAKRQLRNVEGLAVMDAEHLDFPDNSFEVVVAQCVVNTVPNPDSVMDEFARVVNPDGEIVLFNRVSADVGLRHALERRFQPFARRMGWSSEFPWSHFARWLASSPHQIHLIERRPMPPLGHFSLIRFGKGDGQPKGPSMGPIQKPTTK